MKKIFEQKITGDLYQLNSTEVQVSLKGERFFALTHASNIVSRTTGLPVETTVENDYKDSPYEVLNKQHASSFILSQSEFESDFTLRLDIQSQGNSPIRDLMDRYEEEECDFSDSEFLVRSALRLTDTMSDSQARCILYALALELSIQKT